MIELRRRQGRCTLEVKKTCERSTHREVKGLVIDKVWNEVVEKANLDLEGNKGLWAFLDRRTKKKGTRIVQ